MGTYTFNTIVFIIITVSLFRGRVMSTYNSRRKATLVFMLAGMFGIAWIFGILQLVADLEQGAASLVFQVIFILVVGFQGFLIFLLYPCRKKEARNQWKKLVYYATCRTELSRHIFSGSTAQKVRGQHSSSTPSVRKPNCTRSTLVSARGSLIYQRQASLDNISTTSSAGISAYRAGQHSRSISDLRAASPMSAGSVTPMHLQAPTLDTVQEESIAEEVSPYHSLAPSPHSSGGSFHIFGNDNAEFDSDDDYFHSQ